MKRSQKFLPVSAEHLKSWAKENPKIVKRILELLNNIDQTPFEGLGKPEPLKHEFKGKWSRRIDEKHRQIYEVADAEIIIYSCTGHYE